MNLTPLQNFSEVLERIAQKVIAGKSDRDIDDAYGVAFLSNKGLRALSREASL